jgi:CBS domain-containing protein
LSTQDEAVRVGDVMNPEFTTILASTSMREAAGALCRSGASDLVVVDASGAFVGVLAEGDLLRAVMPRIDELPLGADSSLAEAFERLVVNGRHLAEQPIDRLVIRDPIVVRPEDPLLNAATVMVTRQIRRIPVVDRAIVVGTIARADVCRGLLAGPQADATQAAASS